MTTLPEFVEIARTYREALEGLSVDQAAHDLRSYFAPVFDADPSVQAIVWGQWAPYFNDGEPCRFGLSHEGRLCRVTVEGCPDPWSPEGEGDDYWDCSHPQDEAAGKLLAALPLDYLARICPDGVLQACRDGRLVIGDYGHN